MVQNTFDNYNRMGDVATIAICCVIFILLATSYISRTRSFWIFCVLVGVLLAAAILNIGYHDMLMVMQTVSVTDRIVIEQTESPEIRASCSFRLNSTQFT